MIRPAATTAGLVSAFVLAGSIAVAKEDPPFSMVAPKQGTVIARGKPPTFAARLTQAPDDPRSDHFAVFVRVSGSDRTDKNGLIGDKVYIDQLHLQRSAAATPLYRGTARTHTYRDYWLNKRATYYWQAYYVYCTRTSGQKEAACYHPGPIRKLRIK
jgi:hypothetical protein